MRPTKHWAPPPSSGRARAGGAEGVSVSLASPSRLRIWSLRGRGAGSPRPFAASRAGRTACVGDAAVTTGPSARARSTSTSRRTPRAAYDSGTARRPSRARRNKLWTRRAALKRTSRPRATGAASHRPSHVEAPAARRPRALQMKPVPDRPRQTHAIDATSCRSASSRWCGMWNTWARVVRLLSIDSSHAVEGARSTQCPSRGSGLARRTRRPEYLRRRGSVAYVVRQVPGVRVRRKAFQDVYDLQTGRRPLGKPLSATKVPRTYYRSIPLL